MQFTKYVFCVNFSFVLLRLNILFHFVLRLTNIYLLLSECETKFHISVIDISSYSCVGCIVVFGSRCSAPN